MKFLQIGLGSMGKRRIRNLLFCGVKEEDIAGFDLSKERCKEASDKYGVKTFTSYQEAKAEWNPDVYVISTPPNLHHMYFLDAAKQRKHFFVEVGTTDEGYEELFEMMDGSFVAAPSCTFRYFPAIKKINEIVNSGEIGETLSFHYHMGQYLPDWHPWEDYRKVYFAQKETSACREMYVFELIWLTHILKAMPKEVLGYAAKVSDLDMSADDLFSSVVKFDNDAVGTFTIDVISRNPVRTLRLVGTEGSLDWEWMDYKIKVFNKSKNKFETYELQEGEKEENYVTTEDMYREEMQLFLDAINGGKQYPHSFADDQRLIDALKALEGRKVQGTQDVFIIAEAGVNHNGDLETAKKMIEIAKSAGVDAIKFQTFNADNLVTRDAEKCEYQKENDGVESQYEMLKRLELSKEDHKTLKNYCEEVGILFLSTPFSEEDADFLEEIGMPIFKIPSGEITNIPYLKHVAKKGKPMIVSTGMSDMDEVKNAASEILKINSQLTLLHCTSNYPASHDSLNLRAIETMKNELQLPIGYSDHSEGILASSLAVSLGACVIEKHFTLDKNMEGPDHKASIEPAELTALVKSIRNAEEMLGSSKKEIQVEETEVKNIVRKSIITCEEIKAGEIFTKENLTIKRPGTGMPPQEIENIVGKKAKRDLKRDTLITKKDYE